MTGFEPAVSALTGQRVRPLHYTPEREKSTTAEETASREPQSFPQPDPRQTKNVGAIRELPLHSFVDSPNCYFGGGIGVLVGVGVGGGGEVGVGVGGIKQTPGSVPSGVKPTPHRHVLSTK